MYISIAFFATSTALTLFEFVADGSSGSDKNNVELEPKRKAVPRRETPNKPNQTPPIPTSVALNVYYLIKNFKICLVFLLLWAYLVLYDLQKQREQKDSLVDEEKLASARRRLHENYQEAQNGLYWSILFKRCYIYCVILVQFSWRSYILILMFFCSKKTENNSSDGYSWHSQTQEYILCQEQGRRSGKTLVITKHKLIPAIPVNVKPILYWTLSVICLDPSHKPLSPPCLLGHYSDNNFIWIHKIMLPFKKIYLLEQKSFSFSVWFFLEKRSEYAWIEPIILLVKITWGW